MTSAAMALSIFIPDFRHGFEAAGRPRLPALERLVARGAHKRLQPAEFLAPLFGLDAARFAPAPFMYLGDTGLRDGEYRLCADFVHLAPDRDQLVLMPGALLDARREEWESLAAAFDALYGMEGWNLEVTPSGRAYLRAPRPLDLATWEPEAVAGSAVLDYMPTGADAPAIRQLLNESQMLFHTDPVNQAREEAGRPLINSLWPWGGGVLPGRPATRSPGKVLGESPLLRGLALWAGLKPEAAAPQDVHEDTLLCLEAVDPAALEREWFAPLLARLKRGAVRELDLHLGGIGLYKVDSAAARRFWRRPKSLTWAGA